MKNKKVKPSKGVNNRKRVLSDVSPSTSIPPLVEGQLRCFLRVTVSKVLWTITRPPPVTLIRLRWWGESSSGTFFGPRDGHVEQKGVKSTARFPVRCGPKQLTSYLTDMGSLVLDVLTKVDHLPIARAQIPGIARLSLSHSINGYFTLVSPLSEKLGELQVGEMLSRIHIYSADQIYCECFFCFCFSQVLSSQCLRSLWKFCWQICRQKDQTALYTHVTLFSDAYVKCLFILHLYCPLFSNLFQLYITCVFCIFPVLLERGSKLRNAMVVSALKSDVESDNDFVCVWNLYALMFVMALFLSVNGSVLQFWDGEGSFPDSLSDHSSVLMDSELNDPQYDQSLLENLFYKAPVSHIVLDSEDVQHSEAGDDFSGLSMDKIALLGDIRFARVTISEFKVSTESISRSLSKKGRPPRPLTTKKCFYIVEYLFPLVSAGFEDVQRVPSEITKVVSSKVTEGVVMFQHQSLFPVRFSRSSIKQWWEMNVTFKIYSRNSLQKTPVLIGSAMFPLSSLMQSESLTISAALPVQRPDGNIDKQAAGPLKVSFELAADKNDFSNKKRPAKRMLSPARPPPSRLTEEYDGPKGLCVTDHRRDPSPSASVHQVQSILIPPTSSRSTSPHVRYQSSLHEPLQQEVEDTEILLHMLLMVPDGKDFNCAPMQPNVYLNCKLLGSDETARSTVSWGQKHPSFGFIQVAPVTLTGKLLERMKNNMMVIEVWLRASSSDHDKLLGLVKLPLHQFYMSFRDPKITELLLQSQYPVVGVDSFMPVVDVFSGSTRGHLRVCLAMGLAQQITALQRMRDDELTHVSPHPRPAHMLDHRPHASTTVDVLREHVFMVRVERVKGLTPLQSTVWGEADCYIQYSFPSFFFCSAHPTLCFTDVELKAYRTETTLCVPDPVFGHNETHVLLAPPDVPVQRMLLSSLARQGLRNGGGVQFEVWCRYYYPNVRDQLVARGLLPMSKLCAMVTMQKQGQTDAQLFSLPLVPRTDQPQPSGLLEVSVQYKSRPMRSVGVKSGVVPSRRVMLVVQVHRAAGLQAAAKALADADSSLLYYSEVGLNSFITMQLSFLPDSEVRSTRVVARSFCPEFEHHAEFCCNLLVQRDSGESVSLAELLQEAVAVFTIYNRDTRKMADTIRSKDTVLGTVKIRLADLIHKRSGMKRSTYCYYRYKLYNQQTFCSELRHPVPDESEGEEGLATVAFQGSKSVVLRRTQPLRWFLREEKLEVQVWVAFGKEKRVRPHNADHLVGSAFVDLSALAGTLKTNTWFSLMVGVYPLFKRSAVNLSGAALRVHITVTTDSEPHEPQATEELNSSVEDEEDGGLPTTVLSRPFQSPSKQQIKSTMTTEAPPSKEINNEDTFIANITVDRAMHLSLKGCPLAERGGGLPSCCVSYAIADAPGTVTTALIKDSDCPMWDHQQECRLSKELLLDPQQSLVFKVWHKGEVERVIGFVSVDLSPLLSGFQSVCGWYNITDFSGQCQGQLKVSVSPLRAVQEFRTQRLPAHEPAAPDSSVRCVFRYGVTDRHDEHMDNIRMFHQSLHEEEKASQSSVAGDSHPSSSALFSALRKNLSELDDIQRYFSRKLSTPSFPKLSELRGTSRLDEHRDSETDTTQLLLKSSHQLVTVSVIPVYLKPFLTLYFKSGLSEPQTEESPAAAEDEKLHHRSSDHSSEEEECKDEDEHEDFEETLIQPRTLNEVTSVTDRTSPWTSLLSDPDMGSLESLELVQHHAHDDTIHIQGEERNSREILPDFNPQSLTAESQAVDSDSDISERSETDLDTCRSDGAIATDHREQQPSLDGLDGDGAFSSISEVEDYEQSNSAPEEGDLQKASAESGSETDEKSDERTAKPYPSKLCMTRKCQFLSLVLLTEYVACY
uniref:C2 domain containing 3 centriole elongation regulator n=1 Tax=Cyprinus carpio TaxID=7962 RepID=A0A8C1Z2P2_CYPCA